MMFASLPKNEALRQLGAKRQSASWPGYGRIGDYHAGAYDSPQVSPYTRGAGNWDSPIFLLLQDWCDESYLLRSFDPELARIGRDEALPTNVNLHSLLRVAFGKALSDVYATNLFPFVKRGGMSASIPRSHLLRAVREFTIPEITIVQPRLVVCLGSSVFRAMHEAISGRVFDRDLSFAVQNPLDAEIDGLQVRLWGQAHPGALGLANRGRSQAIEDWKQMGRWLAPTT